MEVEVFPKAPVEEAIISFEVPFLDDDLTTSAEHFHRAIAGAFPQREEIYSNAITRFSAARQSSGRKQREPNAVQFTSTDGLQVVALTRDGLSFHRLRPYVDWHHFEAGARQVWNAFANYFGPEEVTELRLRYLNRIVIPVGQLDLPDYFNTYPHVPVGIDTGMGDFLMRLRLVDESVPSVANLTMRADVGNPPKTFPIVFDIEVTLMGRAPVNVHLWNYVNALREYKNRLFFNSITDETRALFR